LFRAGDVGVRMSERWRRLVDRETNEILAEQASFWLSSVDRFASRVAAFPIGLNQCDGAERGRPTASYALRPFAAPMLE